MTTKSVGLDAIGIAVPSLTLELAELARARGVDPAKFIDGLGVRSMSIAPVDEDTVTLAVRAAKEALAQACVSPSEIGMCIVGTETAVDHSKPVASFVQGLLGLPTDCRIFETKHACYGATAGLQNALDWIRAGSNDGKKALIIASDIARYGLRTAGEPTQGAGAVALLVSEAPRLIAFDDVVGTYANDVTDFWRPLHSKDAFVDGHYSVGCYLDALAGAYTGYRKKAERKGTFGDLSKAAPEHFSDRFAAIAYHVPYGKMAIKAHRHLRALDGDGDAGATVAASFTKQVAASLVLPREVGNIYTGSLYLALASALTETDANLDGERVALFSYGSGSCAEFWSGVVQPGAQARVRASGWKQAIAGQRKLGIEEYERILTAREQIDTRPYEAPIAGSPGYFGIHENRRMYKAVQTEPTRPT